MPTASYRMQPPLPLHEPYKTRIAPPCPSPRPPQVLLLVPTAGSRVLPLLLGAMPHKLRGRGTQCLYLRALFSLAERRAGAPVREGLLAGVVEHLASIDVEIRCGMTSHSKCVFWGSLFDFTCWRAGWSTVSNRRRNPSLFCFCFCITLDSLPDLYPHSGHGH